MYKKFYRTPMKENLQTDIEKGIIMIVASEKTD